MILAVMMVMVVLIFLAVSGARVELVTWWSWFPGWSLWTYEPLGSPF